MSERCFARQTFMDRPAVKPIEASDCSVPGARRDALLRILAPSRSVIGKDVLSVRIPDGLAAGVGKEPNPDQNIVAIGAKGMARPHATEGKVEKEAIEMRIVERPVSENHRDVSIETVGGSLLLNCDVGRRDSNIHSLFNPSPGPHPGASNNGRCSTCPVLSRPASASYVGALRPAWKSPQCVASTSASR